MFLVFQGRQLITLQVQRNREPQAANCKPVDSVEKPDDMAPLGSGPATAGSVNTGPRN